MVKLSLENVVKTFPDGTKIGPLNVTVPDGNLHTLLGPSGCGKTTTLRMIAGLITPDDGVIKFDDVVVNDIPPQKRNIGMVFQTVALFPHLNVYENIAFGLDVRKVDQQKTHERVMELAEILEIKHLLKKMPNEISGGEGQRVAIARALAPEPKVLLMDEPLSSLDALLRERLKWEIRKIQQEFNVTTIYVTHSQEEAFAISDSISIMNKGYIIQNGTPEEILQQPKNKFVAEFIGMNVISRESAEKIKIFQDITENNKVKAIAFSPESVEVKSTQSENTVKAKVILATRRRSRWQLQLSIGSILIYATILPMDKSISSIIGKNVFIKIPKEEIILIRNDNTI